MMQLLPRHLRRSSRFPTTRIITGLLTLLAVLTADIRAQGNYVNYEAGAVSPLALHTFTAGTASRTVLMACNTANDALEFYDASNLSFIKSIPTGLSPVTVRWDDSRSRAYTCNAVGDSVTCVAVAAIGANGSQVQLDIRLNGTFRVGDEPNDIVFVAGTNDALVSLRSRSAVARIDLVSRRVLDERHVLGVDNGPADKFAIKNPRSLAMVGNDRFYALDHQSDGDATDIDLFAAMGPGGGSNPLYDPGALRVKVNGLGTTHANLAINAAGDRMFVVGMRGRPADASTEIGVAALETGFVQSWMWVVDLLPTPVVRGESSAGGSTLPSINLNRDYTQLPNLVQVAPVKALSQPTGIAVVESGAAVSKIVLAAFSTDAIAVLTPDSTSPSGWDIQRLDLGVSGPSYSMAGPRHVVVDGAGQTAYVLCSMDSASRTVDRTGPTPTLGISTPLLHDPTPARIRVGREFLYSAKHSGNNMVSCSSCHVDAHTDGLVWTLNQGPQGSLPDSFINSNDPNFPTEWPADKGPMVTQTLRGLVNHDVDGAAQAMFTNAPYHWRGDRANFNAFNGAFVDLMNRAGGQLPGPDMTAFRNFIETVVHPPNPEQPLDRRLTGDMGGSSWDPALGSEMQRGLKVYHALNFPLSCAHCHVLPEGSGNRSTQTVTTMGVRHPIEPAALRSAFDRESGLVLDAGAIPQAPFAVKESGLFHNGLLTGPTGTRLDLSLSHFVQLRFTGNMPGNYGTSNQHVAEQRAQAIDLTAFVRALDTGTAPIIGFAHTCVNNAVINDQVMSLLLDQVAEANAGIVAHTDFGGLERSFWYDLTSDRFREDVAGVSFTPADLLNQFSPSNTIVLQAVPVGSARRIADYARLEAIDSGNTPARLTLAAMTPPTHWAEAGDLRARWDQNNVLIWQYGNVVGQRESHARMLYMQRTLIAAQQSGFRTGMTVAKHETPRRFRVAGSNIRHGAVLQLHMQARNGRVVRLTMPLFPTRYRLNDTGPRIWETAVEADGEMTLAFLNGGYFLPKVFDLITFNPPQPPYPALDPMTDNSYKFRVQNLDGTRGSGLARLTIRHDR